MGSVAAFVLDPRFALGVYVGGVLCSLGIALVVNARASTVLRSFAWPIDIPFIGIRYWLHQRARAKAMRKAFAELKLNMRNAMNAPIPPFSHSIGFAPSSPPQPDRKAN